MTSRSRATMVRDEIFWRFVLSCSTVLVWADVVVFLGGADDDMALTESIERYGYDGSFWGDVIYGCIRGLLGLELELQASFPIQHPLDTNSGQ
ncbi:hypothetical protein CPB83DRAFT_862157 [Crepidotus variabilis]|uniref:Uncharacterized protein n=1 Tax=Crepidotus variabilis TaxID=179855 RepID=A0A9P6E793_9AGAR|nr:hypothetical protein CPB83DRAFT_862157 [Crepidotus variabilis]